MDMENVNYTLYFLDEETENLLKIKPQIHQSFLNNRCNYVDYTHTCSYKYHDIGTLTLTPREDNMVSIFCHLETTPKSLDAEFEVIKKELDKFINTLEQRGYKVREWNNW